MSAGSPSTQANALFAALLKPGSKDLLGRFLALCQAHPELRSDLQAAWNEFQGVRQTSDVTTPGLALQFEELAREDIDLTRSPRHSLSNQAPDNLLQRLSRRSADASRYESEGELGRGGMGTVYKTWDRDLRRHLAMKVAQTSLSDVTPSARVTLARFLEEAQVTGQLEHPAIVPLHDIGIDAQARAFFTMRLIQGRDLREVIKLARDQHEGWTLTRVLGVLLRVCEAMAFAHSKGVIHRDLKPSNVMTGRFGEVYVVDWGVAKVLSGEAAHAVTPAISEPISSVHTERTSTATDAADSPLLTMDGTVMGTPAYMAPEQAAGRVTELTPSADIYSLGAVLYHLLSGQPPYLAPGDRVSPEVVAARVLLGAPDPLAELQPDLPPELVAICEKAMARKSADRYASMLALSVDLRAFLEGRVVDAFEHGAWAEAKKWFKRNRTLAWTGSLGLLAVMLSLGATAWITQAKNRDIEAALNQSAHNRYVGLLEAAKKLWPAEPVRVPAMDDWIATAEDMVDDLPRYKRMLAQERANAAVGHEQTDYEQRLASVIDGLRSLGAEGGLLAAVRDRRAQARLLPQLSIENADAADLWRKAISSIRDPAECPLYEGLVIKPQLGLLPIQRDPQSGLWEFRHLPSGQPLTSPAQKPLSTDPGSALVLVLTPGGKVDVRGGRQGTFTVALDPFFISKFEITQGQWQRFTGRKRSLNRLGDRHPVENINWDECKLVLEQLGLTLPTEVQWERAAHAGGRRPLEEELKRTANLKDSARPSKDPMHRPVGSLAPNAFGLYDCYGNVWEWVFDSYASEETQPTPGTGLRDGGDVDKSIHRGGSFDSNPDALERRYEDFKDSRSQYLGARPARPLDR